jgi:HPt (histidine-containing phosphotransfer) domain-containing protein
VAPASVAGLAHTLVGSARGIGAWRVAAAAEAVEGAVAEPRECTAAMERLDAAVGEVRLAIDAILHRAATPAV